MHTALLALASAMAMPLAAPAAPALHGPAISPQAAFQKLHAHHTAKKVGHFAYPYGLGIDSLGNLYVADVDLNSILIVSPEGKVLPAAITAGIASPVSVTTDTFGEVYVGNIGGGGYVSKYDSNFSQIQTITANAQAAYSIAVDQDQDLFLVTGLGLAVDDPYGNSLSSNIYGGSLDSVAIGGPNVFTFLDGEAAGGNGSIALRQLGLQYLVSPIYSAAPLGSACSPSRAFCWVSDELGQTLTAEEMPGTALTSGLGYAPVGVAYDPVRNRVYVADPTHAAIHSYNATTLAFERTIL